jgi:hypothetical protein
MNTLATTNPTVTTIARPVETTGGLGLVDIWRISFMTDEAPISAPDGREAVNQYMADA